MIQDTLKRTPLFEEHVKLNARMVAFGGWEMPVQYEGILEEHKHTRNAVTVFDISHMGEFIIEGDGVLSGLDRIVTMNIKDMPIKSSRYGMMLNDSGGVIDDLIVFRLEKNKWFLVVNGATTDKDREHIKKHLNASAVFRDVSMQTGKIDIQGPRSRDVLKKFVKGVENLNYFAFDFFNLLGKNVLISRTGYTGELGYEIFFPWENTADLWKELLKDPLVKPAGLGARDILRLEMGYSLYGHELNEETSPLQSGLKKFIDFEKDFIGKSAVLKQQSNLKKVIVGFISENRRSPREHQAIYNQQKEIGVVTSGTFSPILQKGIGLGFVDMEFSGKGSQVFFGNEKIKVPAVISSRVFYSKGSIKD